MGFRIEFWVGFLPLMSLRSPTHPLFMFAYYSTVKGEITCEQFTCPAIENAICGSDGVTYANECELQRRSICEEGHGALERAYYGECDDEENQN